MVATLRTDGSAMPFRTPRPELLGIENPILSAPMAGGYADPCLIDRERTALGNVLA